MKCFHDKETIQNLLQQVYRRESHYGIMYVGTSGYKARFVEGTKKGTWDVFYFMPGEAEACEHHSYRISKRDALYEALDWCVNGIR